LFLRVENLKIHYKVSGVGEPIVLIHGWGGDLNYFAKLKDHLSQKFKVYVLDLPGFGLSTTPCQVWGSVEYADLVGKFIAGVKIIQPILVGHSLGGKIIIHLVANDLVAAKKIVLISSSGIQLAKSFKIRARIYFFKLLKFLARLPIIEKFIKPRLDFYRKRMGSDDYRNASGIMRSILVKVVNENIVSILPKVGVKTLLMWGDQDFATPIKAGQIMQRSISDSQLKIVVGSGHFPFLDNWEEVKIELDKFLS